MTGKAPVFAKIMQDYLHQVARIEDKRGICSVLGITVKGDGYEIPFFDSTYTITPEMIIDQDGTTASHAIAVIMCKYLLLCPELPPNDSSLVTYKDFRDAAPYVGGFRNTAEKPIATCFENCLASLEQKCLETGAQPYATEVSCQLAFAFQALPRVPIILLFNDADEDFPAQATLLFQKSAASYLDMECLAMIGAALAYRLQGK